MFVYYNMKRSVQDILRKAKKAKAREKAMSDGAYDGRFSTKVVKDKKKEEHRKLRKEKHKLKFSW